MSQVTTIVQADMGETEPTKAAFVKRQPTTFPWSGITSRATTLAGYGITDADSSGAATAAQAAAIATAAAALTAAVAALGAVARSGAYADLTGKPTLGTSSTHATGDFDAAGAAAAVQALLGTQLTPDTGWSANTTAGDKTAVLTSFTNNISGTMVTALNVTSAGLGTALSGMADTLVLVVKKLAAHETALVAGKLPNL
jgi:hypothetical protein